MVEGTEDYEHVGDVLLQVQQRGHAFATEAATILKLHENTIRQHMRMGKVPSIRVGNREVILLADLQNYVDLVESGDLHDPEKNPIVENFRRVKSRPDTPGEFTKFNLDGDYPEQNSKP